MMKSIFLALYILLFLRVDAIFAFQDFNSTFSSENDSTEAGFILRSQDVFWQTGYHPVSLDRMSYMLDSHIYGRYGPSPDFYVDGIPFEPSYFGITFTQLIPIPVHQIKQASRFSNQGSGISYGKPYDSGLLEFATEPLKKGFSISATGQVGHNSGEPGPWAFDPDKVTPNVERFGPWIDGNAAIRFGNWYAKGAFRNHSFIQVDEFLQNRIINLLILPEENGRLLPTKVETIMGLVETGIDTDRLEIRLQGLKSESDDFLFFQPVAREVPVIMESSQLSGVVNAKLSNHFGMRSLVQLREKSLGYRLHRYDHNFDWNRESLLARGSFYFDHEKTFMELGGEYEDISMKAAGLREYVDQYKRGFIQLRQTIIKSLKVEGESRIHANESETALSGSADISVNLLKNWSIGLRGSYDEMLPEQARPMDEWVKGGYTIYDQLGVQGFYMSDGIKSRSREVRLTQNAVIADVLTIDSEIGWIENLSLQIPFQYAAYNFPFSTEPGVYLLQENEGGRRITGHLKTEYRHSTRSRQMAAIYVNWVEKGDLLYNLYWKNTPEISVQHSLYFKPFSDLEFQVKTQYISGREWAEFERLDGRSNRSFYVQYPYRLFTFENELPAHLNVDLTVSKWFWGQRFRGVLLLKNMLNTDYQTHPLGIREGFGYLLRLEMRL